MFKKILLGLVLLITIAVIGFQVYVNSGIKLPKYTNQIVETVLQKDDIPEFIKGKTGFAKNDDVDIWYEVMGNLDTTKGTILLVMGHGATALAWNSDFYQPLVDSGYQVIRYDNRGVGESSWMDYWTPDNVYSLEDMAKDGIAILDKLNVEKAHIIGASMGGMIAQRMAISHSDRVLSLNSIMSTGYMNDETIPFPEEFVPNLTKLVLKYLILNPSEENRMKTSVGVRQLLRGNGDYKIDIKEAAQKSLYELRERKGYNPTAGDQHTAAIEKSGSRFDELDQITAPTLVIHGKSDPLVVFEHGQKYAPMIPNADTLFIEGMGHDMPTIYMDQYHNAILENFAKAKK